MSLNLISSLSFLKSRLGGGPVGQRMGSGKGAAATTNTPPARLELYGGIKTATASLDLYGGVTESDLESSSSDSEDDEDEASDPDSSR